MSTNRDNAYDALLAELRMLAWESTLPDPPDSKVGEYTPSWLNEPLPIQVDPEERARNLASDAYHSHPSNPSSCDIYRQIEEQPYCPCEDDWMTYLEQEEDDE